MQQSKSPGENSVTVAAPTLPQGGGAIQGIGGGWGAAGVTGASSMSLPLPISAGRGFCPALGLAYSSHAGRSVFGQGWGMGVPAFARRSSKEIPAYDDEDIILGPGGEVVMPERDASGKPTTRSVTSFRGLPLGETFAVVRWRPRVEGGGERIESWRSATRWFWMIHAADGSVHLYGVTRRTEQRIGEKPCIAEWLLEESIAANGEKVLYEYDRENADGLDARDRDRDHGTHLYLRRVLYGNDRGSLLPDTLQASPVTQWYFELLFDYGERSVEAGETPTYAAMNSWPRREDPFSSFAYGFELRTWRLCHQVLMFHHLPVLGKQPVLVRRLLLEYTTSPLVTHLSAARWMGYDAEGNATTLPPVSYTYVSPLPIDQACFVPFERMPGLTDGVRYQFADLNGEGLPGILHASDGTWYYREPIRAGTGGSDDIAYGPPKVLTLPAPREEVGLRLLTDITGDGRLDWLVLQPGARGYFTRRGDEEWSEFVPFDAFPIEFAEDAARVADLMGGGEGDLVLIGSRSVRLFPNEREEGFGQQIIVPHDDDLLPVGTYTGNTIIAFADMLGSGQQHLVRVQYDGITVWPNLGRGRFGKGLAFATLPFTATSFDATRVRLVDLDGSGGTDLLYLDAGGMRVFRNLSGDRLAPAETIAWPEGVRYDRLCDLTAADLDGTGCASLVLSAPHLSPRHWRCQLAGHQRPYALTVSDNHMGAHGEVRYRSSAQEWLDEKAELAAAGKSIRSELPFAIQVVVEQRQFDEITGSALSQHMSYRRGYYDNRERELRGFGLLVCTDSEMPVSEQVTAQGFTMPTLVKTWFHLGRMDPVIEGFDTHDPDALPLGPALVSRFSEAGSTDDIGVSWNAETLRDVAQALSGSVIRTETFGLDAPGAGPFVVAQTRHLVRVLHERDEHHPYAIVQPMTVEAVAYRYDRMAADPRVEHTLGLRWDAYGLPTHGVVVHYARREGVPPFEEEHFRRWWSDAHDEAQQSFYVTEAKNTWIHLGDPEGWRVGLPWRSRTDAFAVDDTVISPGDISYERFIDADGPLRSTQARTLTGLSIQRYQGCVDGQASFAALPDYTETAEFDAHAMTAYDEVMTPDELRERLAGIGYVRTTAFLPEDGQELWSARRGFTVFDELGSFHRALSSKLTDYLGETVAEYDDYSLGVARVIQPDGCTTHIEYDYRSLQPIRSTDPNEVVSEVRCDGLGRVLATSFRGTELGEPVGFAPLETYKRTVDSPDDALADPVSAIGDMATACFYDAFAWMDKRRPPHAAVLVSDRYPGDPERQIRISIADSDGFGRSLQQKQLVPPGDAYQVNADDALVIENGQPVSAPADPRWRVSERVEYNNKGLVVRVYRPYFASTHRYIRDEAFRDFGYCDRQFYDALGRPTITLTAAGWMRRETYWPWYTVSEDENDTAAEMEESRAALS